MISLFIDTCNKQIILGILNESTLIDETRFINDNNLSEKLLPSVKELLEKNNITISEINKIFVSIGPGSFTGIRIGVTVAKTLAWARKIDIIPVSSLEVISSSSLETNCALIDARRGYVYAGIYDQELNNIMEDQYILLDKLNQQLQDKKIVYVSYDQFDLDTIYPNVNIAKIVEKHINDEPINPHLINPIYLKKTEAEEKHDQNN